MSLPAPRPISVAELDLDAPDGGVLALRPAPGGPPVVPGDVYALVRLRGRPVATVVGSFTVDEDPAEVLAALARRRLTDAGSPRTDAEHLAASDRAARPTDPASDRAARPTEPASLSTDPEPRPTNASPHLSVVLATRERPASLARALDSLLVQDHPDHELIVVDNAPRTPDTHDLVTRKYAGRVRYVREDTPGLAVAHNTGLAAARGALVAFTDDDVIADPHWLTALAAPFAADPGLGCVTGLILPARLRTPAQILLESHGGFAKGFAPRLYDPARPPADEPLFPFTAGSFGSGANMAFRAEALRRAGGFDPATGTGTPAKGGDDLYAFVAVLSAGFRLRYTAEALVWHHHRDTWQDLRNQAYGYGAGLTAYLTATLVRSPRLLPALLARLPRGLAYARAMTARRGETEDATGGGVPGEHGTHHHPWPAALSRLERRGMLYGPIGYAKARMRTRRGKATP
ncbi:MULTISPECIES: glycosyltransferase [unclassified Streptomyces]|uniref:glycosyltransferase n=1 Tax=unclassified Streptomyces TaxID=2593676 RepID=UPI0006FA49AF|nr:MULTISPECIES: glycosyltransferase [unclassified Streptomyces]KQX57797.1 glycosyl transferase family 2 [Streptomyces sp. Root1304]KRA78681.1 glycosyl transferase family 2 [Streptomyces sp. Root66D1]